MADDSSMEKKEMESKDSDSEQKKGSVNGMAYVAYIIFFIPLLTDDKDDPFVKYHVKQGLTLFLAYVIAGIVSMIPFLGWVIGPLLYIGLFVLWILGLVNVSRGEKKPLPIIGGIGEKWSF